MLPNKCVASAARMSYGVAQISQAHDLPWITPTHAAASRPLTYLSLVALAPQGRDVDADGTALAQRVREPDGS